jgi:hypothetical protein
MGRSEQTMLCVISFFKGRTINKKSRLNHDLLRLPETRIFKWLGYRPVIFLYVKTKTAAMATV